MNGLRHMTLAVLGAAVGAIEALGAPLQHQSAPLFGEFDTTPWPIAAFLVVVSVLLPFARNPLPMPRAFGVFAAGMTCSFGALALLRYFIAGGPQLGAFIAVVVLSMGVFLVRSLRAASPASQSAAD